MKQFLYLVQSRNRYLENHKSLESENSDCVILTYEQKIEKENYLYLPNSVWEEGRNVLIDYAKKLPYTYDFYVLMDDDVFFEKGDIRKFEKEVLYARPDFSVPLISNYQISSLHYKLITKNLRFSNFIEIDSPLMCFSRQFFFSPVLPYETYHSKIPKYRGTWVAQFIQLMTLFASGNKNMFNVNAVIIKNTAHETKYRTTNMFEVIKMVNKVKYKYDWKNVFSFPVFVFLFVIVLNYLQHFISRYTNLRYILLKFMSVFKHILYIFLLPHIAYKDILLNQRIEQSMKSNRERVN